MKRLFFWLWLLVKRQLKSPAMLAFLIGMPLVCVAISSMPAMKEEGVPKVALFVSDGDEVALDTINHLVKGQYSVEFYLAKDREQLSKDIEQGYADHGYYFKDGLTLKLKETNYDGCISLVQSSSSNILTTMTKEVVFSELFRVYALEVAKDYVKTACLFQGRQDEAIEIIETNYEKYGNSNDTFSIDFEELDSVGNTVMMEDAKVVFPVRGVLAILVFVAGLYGGVWWKSEKRKGVFMAMPSYLSKSSRYIYILVPTVLFAVSAELSMALTGTAEYPFELVKMLCYIVAIVIFVAILTMVIPNERLMVSVIPVFAIACLVLCPVFVSLSPLSPVFKYLSRLLLPFYYIV